jgi:hypothetical protein
MNIKNMVKDKTVKFLYYRDGEFIYETECGFQFPVPLNDLGKATLNASDKAIYFMRWIRKQLEVLNEASETITPSDLDKAAQVLVFES